MNRLPLLALLSVSLLSAAEPPPKLAEQLLSSDQSVRLYAVSVFNKMPAEAKYKMVPDFMVALSSEDPEVRERSSKILAALGVKTAGQTPDAQSVRQDKKALPPTLSAPPPAPKPVALPADAKDSIPDARD